MTPSKISTLPADMIYPVSDDCKGNILIVDDTPNNLHLLSNMLEELGYEVRCAINGAMALRAVEVEHPDLILLDVIMPEINGYEICKQLKENEKTQEIPVIFLSALNETLDKVKAFQIGGVDYITKPFQVEEVLARIENQLMLRRMQLKLQKAEAEALRALAQEKELNRLKSEFTSMISHDFRTPLTVIQAFADLLVCAEQVPDRITLGYYVSKIDHAVEHLLHLLDEVLMIGSLEAGKMSCQPELLDLKNVCHELVETLQLSSNSQHHIYFSCPIETLEAEVDITLVKQILTNLLSNAIKYSPTGSQIDLSLQILDNQVVFQVKDQGIGIPSDNQAQLFDTFYRCSNVGSIKGTGLGLAIVKRCVEAHQGQISVESQEGVGSTFTIRLPRYITPRQGAPLPRQ